MVIYKVLKELHQYINKSPVQLYINNVNDRLESALISYYSDLNRLLKSYDSIINEHPDWIIKKLNKN